MIIFTNLLRQQEYFALLFFSVCFYRQKLVLFQLHSFVSLIWQESVSFNRSSRNILMKSLKNEAENVHLKQNTDFTSFSPQVTCSPLRQGVTPPSPSCLFVSLSPPWRSWFDPPDSLATLTGSDSDSSRCSISVCGFNVRLTNCCHWQCFNANTPSSPPLSRSASLLVSGIRNAQIFHYICNSAPYHITVSAGKPPQWWETCWAALKMWHFNIYNSPNSTRTRWSKLLHSDKWASGAWLFLQLC